MASTASTTAQLGRLERVLNARDLAEACPRIKPGRIYRAGNPAHASHKDVLTLREKLGLRHLLDFRSSNERAEDSAWSLMLSNGVVKTYDGGRVSSVSVDHNAALEGVELHDIELHQLPLLEKSSFIWGLVRRLPLGSLVAGVFWKAFGYEEKMREQLIPEVNKGGLQLVYEILMETGTENILKSLQLLTEGATNHHPQLFFCKLGKDRTGLLAALVLTACGASKEEIVADYARSDGVDDIALGGIEKERDMQGIDPKIFSRAPPEAMERLLKHAEERYGGLRRYMEQIGFTREEQDRLCRSLTEDDW
ncbi:hypothetical protein N2152v2_004085 [Parachlorella kessleri]